MAGLQFWKIKCFRLHLNESRQCFCQRGRGRSFHVDEPKTEKARNQQWRVWCEESGGWEYQKKSREYGRVCKVEDGHRDKTEQCPRYIYESKSYRIHSSHLKVHIRRLQHGFKLSFSCLRTLVERLVSRWALSASQRQLYKCSQKTDQLVLAHDQEINLAVWREKKGLRKPNQNFWFWENSLERKKRATKTKPKLLILRKQSGEKKKGYENQTQTSDSEKTVWRRKRAMKTKPKLLILRKQSGEEKGLWKPNPNFWFWENRPAGRGT